MSDSAKLLYSLILDRMGLSELNGWRDKFGNTYAYFSVKEISRILRCGHDKATKSLRELESAGLIRREKQGLGRPDRIYVPPLPLASESAAFMYSDIPNPGVPETRIQDFDISAPNKTEIINTDFTENYPSICGYDPDEMEEQIKENGKTKVAVKNKLNEILQDIENDEYIEPNHIKLGNWLDTWMEDYSFDKKYSTLKGYKAQIKKHIKPALGKYYLNQISPIMIQHFYNNLSRPDDEGRILSPKSIKNVHTILQAALNQAVKNEYIKKNPCAKARLPKVEKAAIKPLEENQIKLFLERAMADEVYGTIMKVILFTGLREGEAIGLTWDCVDFSKGTLLIEKQLQRRPKSAGGTVLASVKNGKPRLLKPAPTVMQLLKVRYTEQIMQSKRAGDTWMAWKNEEEHAKALVFTNDLGD